jgi:hypothetical protein
LHDFLAASLIGFLFGVIALGAAAPAIVVGDMAKFAGLFVADSFVLCARKPVENG